MTKLSAHFSLEELTHTEIRRFSNEPTKIVLAHLKVTASRMEMVRTLLGHPIIITSGYRSPEVNEAVGGSKTSAHLQGYACDFICPGFGPPIKVCEEIAKSSIKFDQLIHEGGRWTHISYAPDQRMSLLTAHFGEGGTTYSRGIT